MVDVVVVGGCIIDLISYAPRFPKPGETLAGTHFAKGFGGKGANQCVMAKRLGASTGLIAKLGNDSFGKEFFENLHADGIEREHVTFAETYSTSVASITVTEEGLNTIVYVPGAIMQLTPSDVRNAEIFIKNSKVLLCTFEAPPNALFEALTLARKYKVKTVVNAAPAPGPDYEYIYSLIDIICLNEIEVEQATGQPIKSPSDANKVIEILLKKNCSTIILTLGEQGAILYNKNSNDTIHISARKVNAVDSTGAGDAFMGGLVYYLSNLPNLSLKDMIKNSCEIATRSVLKRGTQSSFPFRKELPDELFTS